MAVLGFCTLSQSDLMGHFPTNVTWASSFERVKLLLFLWRNPQLWLVALQTTASNRHFLKKQNENDNNKQKENPTDPIGRQQQGFIRLQAGVITQTSCGYANS